MREYRKKKEHNTWSKAHDDAVDMNDQLIGNLRDLSHIMRFLYEGKGSQKRILIVLEEIGGSITQQKLTERLGIQPESVSEVISKLENAGYIRRTQNESDRRTSVIELTEAGKVIAIEARDQRIRRRQQMFSCLSGSEKYELLSLLEKVNTDWKERYGDIEKPRNKVAYHYNGAVPLQKMHRQEGE